MSDDLNERYERAIKIIDNTSDRLQMLKEDNKELKEKNNELEKQIEELKQDKEMLMKIAMKTPDARAFPQIAHYIYFALIEVLKDNSLSAEEKLESLKIYLKPSLDKDTYQALYYIKEFKQEHVSCESIINELISWIKFAYKLN